MILEIFKYFELKEILGILSLVCKQWKRITSISELWTDLLLDTWNVEYLEEEHLIDIISHSRGFVHVSLNHVKLIGPMYRITRALENSLAWSSKLMYLDLSGQHLYSIVLLLKGKIPPLHTLILDDCRVTDLKCLTAVIQNMKNLSYLSLNNIDFQIPSEEAVNLINFIPKVYYLGYSGIRLSQSDVIYILANAKHLIFFQNVLFS